MRYTLYILLFSLTSLKYIFKSLTIPSVQSTSYGAQFYYLAGGRRCAYCWQIIEILEMIKMVYQIPLPPVEYELLYDKE